MLLRDQFFTFRLYLRLYFGLEFSRITKDKMLKITEKFAQKKEGEKIKQKMKHRKTYHSIIESI